MNILYQSKLKIPGYAARKLWILFLPAARIVLINRFHPEPLIAYFKGLTFDILILILILIYGFYKWKTKKFIITPTNIICKTGYFHPKETVINFDDISCIHTETDWLIKKYNAIRVTVKADKTETPAFSADFFTNQGDKQDVKNKEIELLMYRNDFDKISPVKNSLKLNLQKKAEHLDDTKQKISLFQIIFFAELFSNIPHGIIMVGMVVWWFFDLVGNVINVFLKFGIVFILMMCKIFSFLRNLEKLYGAYILIENGYVIIKSGLIKNYNIIINTNKVISDKYLLLYTLNNEKSNF
ncbi:MAG: hypothetical protein LBL93_07475 [Ruminococcus sp.]|jgi:membrane protein YdbS with pleckstrin-like domain|nr:hypothetical protein [Ruminococcus sp.]